MRRKNLREVFDTNNKDHIEAFYFLLANGFWPKVFLKYNYTSIDFNYIIGLCLASPKVSTSAKKYYGECLTQLIHKQPVQLPKGLRKYCLPFNVSPAE